MPGVQMFQDRLETLVGTRLSSTRKLSARVFARVCAQAGLETAEPPEAFWQGVDAYADRMQSTAKWYSHVRGPVRYAMAAMLHSANADFYDFWGYRLTAEDAFRQLRIHSRGHEEGTLALLQMYLSDSQSERILPFAARLHTLYRTLKTHNWVAVDAGLYPFVMFGALQVDSPPLMLARWMAVNEVLKRNRGFSRKERYIASLILTESDQPAEQITEELCTLHKGARAAGLPPKAVRLGDLAFLQRSLAPGDHIDVLAQDWAGLVTSLRSGPLRLTANEAAASATLLMLHDRIPDDARRRSLTQAKVVADILTVVQRIRRERMKGDANGDGDGDRGRNGTH